MFFLLFIKRDFEEVKIDQCFLWGLHLISVVYGVYKRKLFGKFVVFLKRKKKSKMCFQIKKKYIYIYIYKNKIKKFKGPSTGLAAWTPPLSC